MVLDPQLLVPYQLHLGQSGQASAGRSNSSAVFFQSPSRRGFSPWRITSAYVYEGGWEKLYPIFPLRRPRPSRAGSPDRNSRRPETGRRLSSAVPRGCWPSFSLCSWERRRGMGGQSAASRLPSVSLRLLRPPLPCSSSFSFPPPTGRTGQGSASPPAGGRTPRPPLRWCPSGRPVLELHQMLVVEDLQKQGPGAGRHAEETGQPCLVPARLSPGEIHCWDAPGGQAQQQAPPSSSIRTPLHSSFLCPGAFVLP